MLPQMSRNRAENKVMGEGQGAALISTCASRGARSSSDKPAGDVRRSDSVTTSPHTAYGGTLLLRNSGEAVGTGAQGRVEAPSFGGVQETGDAALRDAVSGQSGDGSGLDGMTSEVSPTLIPRDSWHFTPPQPTSPARRLEAGASPSPDCPARPRSRRWRPRRGRTRRKRCGRAAPG